MSIFRTKSIEQSTPGHGRTGHRLAAPVRPRPDGLRHRRDHRHRASSCSPAGWPRRNAGPAVALSFVFAAVVCALAALCYAEFASTRPGRRVRLHLLLRHPRRVPRLDHRLGPLPGARPRRRGRRGRLVGYLRNAARPAASICRLDRRTPRFDFRAVLIVAAGHRRAGARARSSPPGSTAVMVTIKLAVVAVRHRGGLFFVKAAQLHPVHPAGRAPPRWRRLEPAAARRSRPGSPRRASAGSASSRPPRSSSSPSSASTSSPPPPRRPATRSGTCRCGIIGSLAICTVLYVAVSLRGRGMQPYTELSDRRPRSPTRSTPSGIDWAADLICSARSPA